MKEGLYEKIINEKVRHELSGLSLEEYATNTEKLDPVEARKLLASYISEVTHRALTYIREEPSTNDGEVLLRQIRTCNEVIQTLSESIRDHEFRSMKIEEQGEVLTSVFKNLNTIRAIKDEKPAYFFYMYSLIT